MSSRKRKDPTSPESPTTPSKRTRLRQNSLETPKKTDSIGPACRYGTSRAAYAINGIVDENEEKYLIDWATNLSGNTWSPDWQPKKNANAAAVKLWDAKKRIKRVENNRPANRRPLLTLTHNKAKENERHAAAANTLTRHSPNLHTVNNGPVGGNIEIDNPLSTPLSSQQSIHIVTPSLDVSKFPEVTVQIEPRSSLDKEAYPSYQLSSSNQDTQNTVEPHSDSGFEESSSRDCSPTHRGGGEQGIIPDSQSLPGSSSYIPTQDISDDHTDYLQAPIFIDSNDLSSDIVIPATQASKSNSDRRESEPAPSLREALNQSSLEARTPPLLQIASDPETLVESSRARHYTPRPRPNRRVVIDSPSELQASVVEHQPEVPLNSIEPGEDATEVHISESGSRLPPAVHAEPESTEHSPVFQTQVPFNLEHSVEPSLSSPANFTGPHSGQLLATASKTGSGSQVAPGFEDFDFELSPRSAHRLRSHSNPAHAIIDGGQKAFIEEQTAQNRLSQVTTADESSVSPRRSESQANESSQDQHSKVVKTEEQGSAVPSFVSQLAKGSNVSGTQGEPLPDTIDSRTPPRPPTSSGLDMSDAPLGNASPVAESHMEKMRRRLREAVVKSDEQIEAYKAEKMQSSIDAASPSSSLKQTELEIKVKPANALQSPRGPKSPSLARIAVTPKGPLSPSGVGSPLGIQVTSPRSARSPSKIPEKEPYKPQEEPSFLGVDPTGMAQDLPTPMMASQQASHSTSNAGDLTSTQGDSLPQTMSLSIQNLGPMEFVMPLSMPPRTQKQYIDTYRYFQKKIALFGEGQDVSRDIVEDLNNVLDRVAKVTTHMDLDGGGPSSQDEVDAVGEAGYSASVSEKFQFLLHVLNIARNMNMHIAIVARPGQLCNFIETTLKAQRITYVRLENLDSTQRLKSNFDATNSELKVTLIASGEEHSSALPIAGVAHLVIAFDETFNAEDSTVKAFRGYFFNRERLTPVIRLIVYASLEHINLCLPFSLELNDRLRKLLYYMVHAEIAVGQLAPENLRQSPFNPSRCAEQLLEFVSTGADPDTWSLPSMPSIEDLPVMDSDSSLSDAKSDISDTHKPEGKVRYWPNPVAPKTIPSQRTLHEKRPFDLEYGDSIEVQTKKMRMGVLASKGRSTGPLEAVQTIKDNERIKDLERQLRFAAADKYEPSNPMSWQSRVQVFDEANRERRELRTTITNLTANLEKTSLILSTTKSENLALKSSLAEAQAKINAYHDTLLNHADPSIREYELLRRQVLELQSSDAAKAKKVNDLESDLAFTRQVYQEASTAASTAQTEVTDLLPRVLESERLLAAARLEQKAARADERRILAPHLKEKAALKEALKQRDKDLMGARLDLENMKRGRQGVQTRGSSMQPVGARSPRGSRGVSPAVGGLVPGHGPVHVQGGVAMARGPSGLGGSSRFPMGYQDQRGR